MSKLHLRFLLRALVCVPGVLFVLCGLFALLVGWNNHFHYTEGDDWPPPTLMEVAAYTGMFFLGAAAFMLPARLFTAVSVRLFLGFVRLLAGACAGYLLWGAEVGQSAGVLARAVVYFLAALLLSGFAVSLWELFQAPAASRMPNHALQRTEAGGTSVSSS